VEIANKQIRKGRDFGLIPAKCLVALSNLKLSNLKKRGLLACLLHKNFKILINLQKNYVANSQTFDQFVC